MSHPFSSPFAEVSAEAMGFPWDEKYARRDAWGQNHNSLSKIWCLPSPLPKQVQYSVHNIGIKQHPPLCYAFWPESGKMMDLIQIPREGYTSYSTININNVSIYLLWQTVKLSYPLHFRNCYIAPI
jgi:hypothetical protein